MSWASIALILASVTLSATAQIAFKFGVSGASANHGLSNLLHTIATPGVGLGLLLYAVGTMLWLGVLSRVDLSQAYPFIGLGFAMTTVAGWWLFGEVLSMQRLSGIVIVVLGTVLIARS